MVVKPIAKLSEEPPPTSIQPACVRSRGILPDPNHRHRLEEIRDNLRQDRRSPTRRLAGRSRRIANQPSPRRRGGENIACTRQLALLAVGASVVDITLQYCALLPE